MAYDDVEKDLVGLSLSFCIQDILNGKVNEDRVKCIVTGVRGILGSDEYFGLILDGYKTYWEHGDTEEESKANFERAKEIAWRLRKEERLSFSPNNIAHGHWAIQVEEVK